MPHPLTSSFATALRGWAGDPSLRTLRHGLMAHRGLRGLYRHQAAIRMVLAPAWTAILLAVGHPGLPSWTVAASGVCATVGALAAWSHHHELALDWMADHGGLRRIARYLRRTARERRVILDVPGMIEGAGLLSMVAITAAAAPARGATTAAWSVAFTLMLLYLPLSNYVIDSSWYQPRLAGRAGYGWLRSLLPLGFVAVCATLYALCAPAGAAGPDGAIVLAGFLLRLYADIRLEDGLLATLDASLRDQSQDLSDAVSSKVHSRVKHELRILAAAMDLDAQPPAVQASWHSLVHNVERLRCHPFQEESPRSPGEVVDDVRATVRALAENPAAVGFTCRTGDLLADRLRPTDMALLESVLSDLCANSVREANRLRRPGFGLDVEMRTDDTDDGCRVTVTVTDTGTGFTDGRVLDEHRSSLSVLARRLRRRGGDLELGTAPTGGARVTAAWLAL